MYVKTDISKELEDRVQEAHRLLVDALQPRNEIRIQKSMRFKDIVGKYQAIIADLPVPNDDKNRLIGGGGEAWVFKDDDRNTKLLFEIAFGYGVAKGAKTIYPPEGRETATLKAEALRIIPGHPIIAIWPAIGLGPDIPPRIDLDYLHEYGKRLGYDGKVDDVTLMFDNLGSLELKSSDIKWNLLPEIQRRPLEIRATEQPETLYQQPIVHTRRTHSETYSPKRIDITKATIEGFITKKMSIGEMAERLDARYDLIQQRITKYGLRDMYRKSRA